MLLRCSLDGKNAAILLEEAPRHSDTIATQQSVCLPALDSPTPGMGMFRTKWIASLEAWARASSAHSAMDLSSKQRLHFCATGQQEKKFITWISHQHTMVVCEIFDRNTVSEICVFFHMRI